MDLLYKPYTLASMLLWSVVYCFTSTTAAYAAKNYQLVMHSIEHIQSAEQVEELYMAVTTYQSDKKPRHYEVPEFPRYWVSSHLEPVKEVTLWQGNLQQEEKISLHLSLLERDAPPFNTDDFVGTVVVVASLSDEKLIVNWRLPNNPEKRGKIIKLNGKSAVEFTLSEQRSSYKVVFSFDEKPTISKSIQDE